MNRLNDEENDMNKKIIIIAVVVVLLILGIVIGAVFMLSGKDKAEKEPTYFEYQVGELYTNLADEKKILKFNVVIEYTNEDILEAINKNKSEIVNNIYEIFRRKTYEQTQSSSFQERIREEIREMIIESLKSDAESISNVYFLEFIIQG